MRLEDFRFLLSPEGQRALSEISATPVDATSHLQIATRLSQQFGPDKTHALLETVFLRQHAAAKFDRAAEMYFTRAGLQQASAEVVSGYRAERYARAGFTILADLGCGIGGDAIALTGIAKVAGIDQNSVRLAMAQVNIRAYGRSDRFWLLQADLHELPPLSVEALFFDPGRRDEYGRRLQSVHDYHPPLTIINRWREKVPHQGVKISPGVDYSELPEDAEVEFISVAGEVREAVLWFGALRTHVGRRATLLPGLHTLVDEPVEEVTVTQPLRYLYEPDGAVIRAHLVEQLAQHLGATKIDADIAYLTADHYQPTPFARCYLLEDVFPFQLKRLRQYLRQRGIGQVTIKKRGSPLDPNELRRRLRLKGEGHCIVFLTHVMGEATVLVGRSHAVGE